MYQSDEEDDDDEEGTDSSDDDDDDDEADGNNAGMQLEGAYDPADYENLPVTPEIKDLFGYITKYIPQVPSTVTTLFGWVHVARQLLSS